MQLQTFHTSNNILQLVCLYFPQDIFRKAEAIVTASRKNSLSLTVSYVYGGHSLNILLYCDGGLRHCPHINYLWSVDCADNDVK